MKKLLSESDGELKEKLFAYFVLSRCTNYDENQTPSSHNIVFRVEMMLCLNSSSYIASY